MGGGFPGVVTTPLLQAFATVPGTSILDPGVHASVGFSRVWASPLAVSDYNPCHKGCDMMSRTDRLNCLSLILSVLAVGVALLTSSCLWGVVTDATTSAPISGASVTYTDANGHIGWTTTNGKGWYAFDFATGQIPAAGPITLDVSASGYDLISLPRLADYKDNPKATAANLSSFWDVQSCSLTPSLTPVTADMASPTSSTISRPARSARITNNGPCACEQPPALVRSGRHNNTICDKTTLGPLTVNGSSA
jgi:hypothetical protein